MNEQEDKCKEILTKIYKDEFIEAVLIEKKKDLGLLSPEVISMWNSDKDSNNK